MGSIWLRDLPDVISDAGLSCRVWPGWENRSRSSGGYDQVWAVFAHHTASSTSPDNDCSWMWDNTSGDQPIGAMLLDRTGRVTVGAAGATNCQGKGGPWSLSRGTIPLDKGNAYGIAVEAANNGTGEQWPSAQTDAYTILVAALCDDRGLDVSRDVLAHWEWVEPSCPGRKVDPAGPSPWATGAASWDMRAFRADATAGELPEPEPPEPYDPPPAAHTEGTTTDMILVGRYGGTPSENWAGYYSIDGGNSRLGVRGPKQGFRGDPSLNLLASGDCYDAVTRSKVTSWSQVSHTTKQDELTFWLGPNA